jgi:hypothetical protein
VNLFASEEYASLEYRTAGTLTNQADFPSIKFEPTGKKYEFQCSFVFHIANGKIDRVHEYFDMETIKRALLHGYGYALAFGREEAVEGGS